MTTIASPRTRVRIYVDSCHTIQCETCAVSQRGPISLPELDTCAILELIHGATYCASCSHALGPAELESE
jgi:hypothetical protein